MTYRGTEPPEDRSGRYILNPWPLAIVMGLILWAGIFWMADMVLEWDKSAPYIWNVPVSKSGHWKPTGNLCLDHGVC